MRALLLIVTLTVAIASGDGQFRATLHAQTPTADQPGTVFLIGDSTVKNGSDQGSGKLWGWGHFLGERIDSTKYRVVNHAIGGRSSRTFWSEGRWTKVVDQLRAGDVVLIQFGHNDGGPVDSGTARASLKGVGDESRQVQLPEKPAETVHTYGWYLRQYVVETRGKGATPIIVSPVPRNIWTPTGKVARASKDYGLWASEVARSENVPFIDLNAIAADRYEAVGPETVGKDFFTAADHTHTTEAGARLNSACVAAALASLPGLPIASAIVPSPK